MMNRKFEAWCDQATEKIRYGPDRRAVAKELQDHLEDRYDAFAEQGLSFEEATVKALESMGDPKAIAPQLGAIHRPWLGRLYSIVRFIGITTTALAVFAASIYIWLTMDGVMRDPSQYLPRLLDNVSCFCEPELFRYEEGYRFHINEAAVAVDEDEGDTRLYIQLVIHKFPWMEWTTVLNDFWAIDSEGNYYSPRSQSAYGQRRVAEGGYSKSTGEYHITLMLTLFDTDAQWVELCYDRDGRNIVFHIDLTGGDARE